MISFAPGFRIIRQHGIPMRVGCRNSTRTIPRSNPMKTPIARTTPQPHSTRKLPVCALLALAAAMLTGCSTARLATGADDAIYRQLPADYGHAYRQAAFEPGMNLLTVRF
jgi:hypothetical protein